MSITFFNTEQQTIESVTKLLTAHGYDPAEYDLEKIAADYLHEPGLYESVYDNPGMVWAAVFDSEEYKIKTTKTRDDALQAVHTILSTAYRADDFDVESIVQSFFDRFGHYHITASEVSNSTFWGIVAQHDRQETL
jgi:hypothetical protein